MTYRNTLYIIYNRIILTVLAVSVLAGCVKDDSLFRIDGSNSGGNPGDRQAVQSDRHVLLLYSDGYNSLSDYLDCNIDSLMRGWLPAAGTRDNILLLYTHKTARYGDYKTPTSPYLIRLTSRPDGKAHKDTLVTYPEGTVSSSALQFNKVLTYVNENFPAKGYGLIYLSHATGYLPAGFYGRSDRYVYEDSRMMMKSMGKAHALVPVPYVEPERDPSLPEVRSVGQTQSGTSGNYVSYEIDIRDFAEAIPMKLDYIQFDACLMGGIEVAYELVGKCSKVGFSQAEVLAEGLNYTNLATHLLKGKTQDQMSVCDDYFQMYDRRPDMVYRSATVSLVDCDNLEPLADACRDIFANHRTELSSIYRGNVQRFYTGNHHWFYDLESIVMNCGASQDELDRFYEALDACVLYKAHTPTFLCEFEIDTFSGFSMYMPSDGNKELDKYYKNLRWNIATGLVE